MRVSRSLFQESDAIPQPNGNVKLTAGPGQTHNFSEISEEALRASQMLHRGDFARGLIKGINRRIFDLFGIPEELRDHEFTKLKETPEGWHVCYTNSGMDGMRRALQAGCLEKGTWILHTDHYSDLAEFELHAMGRKTWDFRCERGLGVERRTGVMSDPLYDGMMEHVARGQYKTVLITENATTTGVDQSHFIQELVKTRNEAGSKTLIISDSVSAQILARERSGYPDLPDMVFWANQKDPGIGPGSGHILFNNRALARVAEVRKNRLFSGGELGIEYAYAVHGKRKAKEGQTPHTPPMGELFKERAVLEMLFNDEQEERLNIHRTQWQARHLLFEVLEGGSLGELGYAFLTQQPSLRSLTTHVIRVPEGMRAGELLQEVSKEGYDISPGYGEHKNEEIRICVYSANTLQHVKDALEILEKKTRILKKV